VVAHAQDNTPPGLLASLDVTQRLEYSDNPDLDFEGEPDFYGRTLLDFGLISETPRDLFTFNVGADVEEFGENQSTLDLTNTRVGLGYDRESRNARFGLDFAFRESDVTDSDFDDFLDFDGNLISQRGGTRESTIFGIEGELGREAPIGASIDLRYRDLNFSDTNDPDLTEEDDIRLNGQIFFRFNQRATGRLIARYEDFDSQGNGVDRETVSLGSGLAIDLTPTLSADVELDYTTIERQGDETGTDDGFDLSLGLSRTLRNGTIGVTFASEVETNDEGRRSFLSLNRAMALPSGATIAYEIGGTRSGASSFDPLVNFDYAYDLPDAQIRVGLSQVYNTDRDNQEEINTSLSASYSQAINTLSSYEVSLSFLNRNALGDRVDDGRRLDLSLSYRRDLTADWGLVGGFSHVLVTDDGEPDRSSNTVFVGLQRSFDWNP
jgi:hypothetical protein